MELDLKLKEDDCRLLLNILDYYEQENLNKTIDKITSIHFSEVAWLYDDKYCFEEDTKHKVKIIQEQLNKVIELYQKIDNVVNVE